MPPADTALASEVPVLHTSVFLHGLIDSAPADKFTISWLLESMPKSSYGFLILFFALLSIVPVLGVPANLCIIFFSFQIILGFHSPFLPKRLTKRELSSTHLARIPKFTFSFLRYLERMSRPRWALVLGTRRVSGAIVLFISTVSLLSPVPFLSIPCAMVIVLMALAYIEHDGALLLLAQTLGLVLLVFTLAALVKVLA